MRSISATILPGSDQTSVSVNTTDDFVFEGTEILSVVIASTDPSITIGPDNSSFLITIQDNEGKLIGRGPGWSGISSPYPRPTL